MLNRSLLLSSLAAALACLPAPAAGPSAQPEASLQPFPVDWPASGEFPADVSFLLAKPAGRDGFIRAKDGHLVTPDGKRFRIWGINATATATVPPKPDAPVIAANLARRGINCVRFHFLDRQAPAGLVDATRNDTRALDPNQLDRLDFFIAELKQRGIYADLNLNVGRTYKAGDGVRDHDLIGYPKALTYFDERLIELQKEYARQLLTHVNGYTGNAYRDEPAVAVIEFVNENSLVESWVEGRLLGRQTTRPAGPWNDIPATYAEALTAKYNQWLAKQLAPQVLDRLRAEAGAAPGAPLPRLEPKQFKHASPERFRTEARFYMAVESDFFQTMARHLRDELKVRSLLIGNSDHGHGHSGYPIAAGTSLLDVVDSHVYWQHPRYLPGERRRRTAFEITNSPMVDDPLHSTVVQLSRTAVAGKPFTVSEVNHPFPAEFACEGVPILAAYGALQDWDGIFWYTLEHHDILALGPAIGGHFDFAMDPVKMSQLAAGAVAFLRGDVRPAVKTAGRSYTRDQVCESLRLPRSEAPYFTPGFPLHLPLQHAVRVTSFDGPPASLADPAPPASPHRSDTGELAWRFGAKQTGLVTVDTPRSQALAGFCRGEGSATANLEARVDPDFCALTLSALDDQPIAASSRLLLTAGARVANTGMVWNEKRTSLVEWGREPTLIEPVRGEVRLKNLAGAKAVAFQPLDGAGRPLGAPASAQPEDGNGAWRLILGQPATTWFLVTVTR